MGNINMWFSSAVTAVCQQYSCARYSHPGFLKLGYHRCYCIGIYCM